jgi:glycosyltransferase involved in cell wall biosynthesis
MVMLEAWALGIPVLANSRCEVLKGQCLRSNAGLFYDDDESFIQALNLLLGSPGLRKSLGENGEEFFRRNYTWEVIENKYLNLLGKIGGKTE